MKNIYFILLASFCWLTTSSTSLAAHFSVTDYLLIKTNMVNAKKDLLEQLLQETNQQTQIKKQLEQIRQVEDFLKRLGKLEDVKDLPGFKREAESFLRELERNLSSFEIIRDIKADEVFKQQQGSPYETIKKDIIIDGKKVSEVDGNAVLPELAARRTIAHYQQVRSKVLQKRSQLKGELELAMQRLNTATTAAEVDKLTAVINALNIQIKATDSDMQFASNEVMTRYYQNQIEADIQQKVQVQKEQAKLRQGMKKHFESFKLPNRPALFKPSK